MSNRPKMILFDYGQTLVGTLECNWLRGRQALMPISRATRAAFIRTS